MWDRPDDRQMTMRRGVAIGFVALSATAAVAFLVNYKRDADESGSPAPAQSSGNVVEHPVVRRHMEAGSAAERLVPSAAVVAERDWLELLKLSTDYRDFVDRALLAATNGDASAQFAIYQALDYCETGYRAYFDRPGRRRTLDEALTWASTRPAVSMDHVREVYGRCDDLITSGTGSIGSAESWLQRSVAAGLPAAQARQALAEFEAVERQSAGTTDRTQSVAEQFDARRSSARALLLKSLTSGDARAIWDAADSIKFVSGSETTAVREQWVWRMAACMQGYDCAAGAAWLVAACHLYPSCPPGESGIDYIRRVSGWDTTDLELQARRLADRLRSGNFNEGDLAHFMGVDRTP